MRQMESKFLFYYLLQGGSYRFCLAHKDIKKSLCDPWREQK